MGTHGKCMVGPSPWRLRRHTEDRVGIQDPDPWKRSVESSTLLAIIEQRAHGLGFSQEGGTHWRASPPAFVVKLVGACPRNVFVRDLDLMGPGVADGRRLDVVVNGLPLFSGSQIAVDTTLVSALHSDGTPLRRAAAEDGVALTAAALRKSRTYPELVGPRARARLVVMGVEVGGRWAPETRTFLSLLARRERGVSAGCYSEEQSRRGA